MEKLFVFGDYSVRNVMLDTDGTNLEEGIEITDNLTDEKFEFVGYRDLDEMTNEDVLELVN